MTPEFNGMHGRAGIAVAILLALLAAALIVMSERAAPPEPARVAAPEPEPVTAPSMDKPGEMPSSEKPRAPDPAEAVRKPVPASDDPPRRAPPENVEPVVEPVSLAEAGSRFRVAVAERMTPAQLELLAGDRLLERLVATVHSLDGEPVPLRFRPLAHVAGLPRIAEAGDERRLPGAPDPRYAPYRALFDRFDVETLAGLFDRHEPALQRAWEALGEESDARFRDRVVAVLRHLADFEMPDRRPRLVRPEVLYEFADPALERLSWGRKLLIRIGPAHAPAVQRKADELADRLASGGDAGRR